MNNPRSFYALTLAIVLTSVLSGCATFRKCETDRCSDDTKIKANVQALLDSQPQLGPPNAILVQSIDHVVYLYGLVDTSQEKRIAESVASQAPGVIAVVNSIEQNNQ